MLYDVCQTVFLRETGKKHEPGDTVELPEDVAARLMAADPYILKPHRRTTEAHPTVVREAAVTPPARVRTRRAKK